MSSEAELADYAKLAAKCCLHVPYSSIDMAVNKEESDRQMIFDSLWDIQWAGASMSASSDSSLQAPDECSNAEFRKKFKLDSQWFKEGDILLRLEVIANRMEVLINGRPCGISEVSPYPISIKPLLKRGNNEIVLKLDGRISSLPIRLRSVSLVRLPIGGILDLRVFSYFDASFKDAFLNVRVSLDNNIAANGETRVVAWRLYEESGEILASSPLQEVILGEQDGVTESEIRIVDPLHWNADTPHLYNLVVIVADKKDRIVDVRAVPWGFRHVTILSGSRGNQLVLNGRHVILRGAEQLDFCFSAPYQDLKNNLQLVKQRNINAVCAPPHTAEDFFHIADRLGIYVVGELDGNSKDSTEKSIHTIRNFRYHSSILAWLPGKNADAKEMRKELAAEGSRQILASTSPFSTASEILVLTASSLSRLVRILKKKAWLKKSRWRKPVLVKGISNNTEAILRLKHWLEQQLRFAGSFVGSISDWRNDSFQAMYIPVVVAEDKLLEGFISIENRCDFANLNLYDLQWSIQRNGEIVAEGLVRQPDIAPKMRKHIRLYRDLSTFPGGGEGFLNVSFLQIEETAWAPAGSRFVFYQIPVPELQKISNVHAPKDNSVKKARNPVWRWKQQGNDLLAASPDAGIRHDCQSGTIEVLDLGYGNVLSGSGIYPVHLPNTPDNSAYYPVVYSGYRIKLGKRKLLLSYRFHKGGQFNRIRLELSPVKDGGLEVLIKTHPLFRGGSMALRMELNLQYDRISWYGPHRDNDSYAVSLQNASIQALAMENKETVRTDVRWMEFSSEQGNLHISGNSDLLSFFVSTESGNGNPTETAIVCIKSSRHVSEWLLRFQSLAAMNTPASSV